MQVGDVLVNIQYGHAYKVLDISEDYVTMEFVDKGRLTYDTFPLGTISVDLTQTWKDLIETCYNVITPVPEHPQAKSCTCTHPHKYLNKFQTFSYWFCPDCKEEV